MLFCSCYSALGFGGPEALFVQYRQVTESIESFLTQSALSGSLDSEGQFTIDLENARRKTIEYGLDRPDKGLLKLVQAAVQGGAMELSVKVLKDELRLDISGSPELEKQAEEAGEPLSVALWSCLYSGFGSLTCETRGKSWRLTREGFQELQAFSTFDGLRIRMHRAREEGFWAGLKSMLTTRAKESLILRDRLEHCHLPVELGGRVINRSAEKVGADEKLLLRLQLMGPPETASNQIYGGYYGLAQAKLTFRNTVKLDRPTRFWTTFAAMQKPADPSLFGGSWTPATYMGSGRVMAELLMPFDRNPQELVFVKQGVEVGKVSYPWRGSISALGVDVDASGLSMNNNPKLEKFLNRLNQVALSHLGELLSCDLPAEVAAEVAFRMEGFHYQD